MLYMYLCWGDLHDLFLSIYDWVESRKLAEFNLELI